MKELPIETTLEPIDKIKKNYKPFDPTMNTSILQKQSRNKSNH